MIIDGVEHAISVVTNAEGEALRDLRVNGKVVLNAGQQSAVKACAKTGDLTAFEGLGPTGK